MIRMGTRTIEVSDLFKSMIRGMMKELHKKEYESIYGTNWQGSGQNIHTSKRNGGMDERRKPQNPVSVYTKVV